MSVERPELMAALKAVRDALGAEKHVELHITTHSNGHIDGTISREDSAEALAAHVKEESGEAMACCKETYKVEGDFPS